MRDVDVAWITDPNEVRAKELAKVYRVPFRSFPKDLTQLPEADVYLMACPFGVRDPYFALLRDRQAPIYVEKPFARTAERHAELCSAFPDYALASGLMMRCWGTNVLARKVLQQQLFGPLKTIRFGFGKPGIVTQGNYYFETKRGGAGMLSEVGIHGIDSSLFVSRARRAEVESVNTLFAGDLDLHTEAKLKASDAEGHQFAVEFTISSLQPTIEGIEIECEHATLSYPLPGQGYALIAEEVGMGLSVRPKNGGGAYRIGPEYVALHPSTKFQMFHENWQLFLEGVSTRSANRTSAAESYLTTDVIERCLHAGSRAIALEVGA